MPASPGAAARREFASSRLAADATTAERRAKSLTMRNAGATYPKIAEQFGVSVQQSKADVRRAIRDLVKLPAEQMVDRQRAILLDIARVNYAPAMGGDKEAQAMLLKVLEHEAKLYGLYAPARVNLGISEAEFAKQAAQLLAVVGPEPLLELARTAEPAPGSTASEAAQSASVTRQVIDAEVVPVITPAEDSDDQLERDEPEPDTWSNL